MRRVIGMMAFAATLVGCDSSTELAPEVAQRTAAVDDAAQAVGAELSHYTATMMLAADDLYTLHSESADYGDRARGNITELFIALADVYGCASAGDDVDALDAMSGVAVEMWQEVAYHRMWLPRIGEVSICKTEVRRHQAAMEELLARLFELQPELEAEAVGYQCR